MFRISFQSLKLGELLALGNIKFQVYRDYGPMAFTFDAIRLDKTNYSLRIKRYVQA